MTAQNAAYGVIRLPPKHTAASFVMQFSAQSLWEIAEKLEFTLFFFGQRRAS
jgi:hypothetical protein